MIKEDGIILALATKEVLEEVLSVMDLEELIRMRHRLRKAGRERGWRRMEEEIRKREREGE